VRVEFGLPPSYSCGRPDRLVAMLSCLAAVVTSRRPTLIFSLESVGRSPAPYISAYTMGFDHQDLPLLLNPHSKARGGAQNLIFDDA
jgi:hypothetical protein